MHELKFALALLLFLTVFLGLGLGFAGWLRRLLPRELSLFDQLVLGILVALPLAFLMASIGALGPTGASLGAALAALGLLYRRRDLIAAETGPRRWPFTASELLPLLAVLAVLLPEYWLAIGPTVHWDSAVYHLTLPRIYLEAGGFVPVELNVYSLWPHGPQLLYAFGLLFGGPPLAKLLQFAAGLLVVVALYQTLARDGRPGWRCGAWVAIGVYLVHPVLLFELQAAYVDLVMALFYFSAFLFFTRAAATPAAAEPQAAGPWLLMAGLAGGGVAVCKPTGVLFLPALLPVLWPFLLARWRAGQGGTTLLLCATRLGSPLLLFWLPWVWRSYRLTGNPVYPFLWGTFGGPDWNAELAAQLVTWQRGIGMGRGVLDYLLLPWRVLTAGDSDYAHFDGRLSWLILPFLLLALWRACRQSPPSLLRPALLVAGLYFGLWALSSQQMRFLIPMLPLLALAAGLAVADLAGRLTPRLGRWAGAASVLALVLPWAVYAETPSILTKALRHAAIYRHPRFVADPWGAAPSFRRVLLELPPDAKILMLNSNQGFYCPRPFLADSFFEASQITAWLAGVSAAELPARLAERGVTHILFSQKQWRVRYPDGLLDLLAEERDVRSVWRSDDGEWLLYELRR